MKCFYQHIKLICFAFFAITSLGCREESPSCEDQKDEDKVTVRFLIPQAGPSFGYSTRSEEDDYLGNGEAGISNLYIVSVQLSYFAYNENGTYDEQRMDEGSDTGRHRVIITPINVYTYDGKINKENYYNLTLYPGRYRFYLFGNCDRYVNNMYEASGLYTEDYVKEIFLNFDPDVPLRKNHLPMACTPDGIKYDNFDPDNKVIIESRISTSQDANKNYLNYTVPIYKNSNAKVYADLKFLCSKVRYTILFDDTQPVWDEQNNKYTDEGISAGFGNQSIRFYVDEAGENRPLATNLRKKTFLYPNLDQNRLDEDLKDPFLIQSSDNSQKANWPMELSRYYWPDRGDKYPSSSIDALTPWDKSLDDWKASRQRAWQGIVYLPENNNHKIDKTLLQFPYVIDRYALDEDNPYKDNLSSGVKTLNLFGNNNETQYEGKKDQVYEYEYGNKLEEKDYSTGLERGVFYDVVARVINPDEWDLKVIIYAKIEDWHEIEQDVEEPGWFPSTDKSESSGVSAEANSWNYNSSSGKW